MKTNILRIVFFGAVGIFLMGAHTSNAQTPPTITYQSPDKMPVVGENIELSVTATGTAPMTYQWYKNNVAIPNATDSFYKQQALTVTETDLYKCAVTNSAGRTFSSNIYVVTTATAIAPKFTSYSSSNTYMRSLGEQLSLSPIVSGSTPITYQWYKNGQAISGATTLLYIKPLLVASDAGVYACVAVNAAGRDTSRTVNVVIQQVPYFDNQPTDMSVIAGNTLFLTTSASGERPIKYQWYKDNTPISNANDSTYFKASVTTADNGTYKCIATNAAGADTTDPIIVTITGTTNPPAITSQSENKTLLAGGVIELKVTATGTPPLNYQWYKNGLAIDGAKNSVYRKSLADTTDNGIYKCIVVNDINTTTGNDITVKVKALPVITIGDNYSTTGAAVELKPITIGSTPITKWFIDGKEILPADGKTYLDPATLPKGEYTIRVASPDGKSWLEKIITIQ